MIEWTKTPDPEFKERMFDLAIELRDMILSTSGSEEGMNVIMSVLASMSGSISDSNWNYLVKTATSGVVDEKEYEIGNVVKEVFIAIDKLRTFTLRKKSKYIKPVEDPPLKNDDLTWFFKKPDKPC